MTDKILIGGEWREGAGAEFKSFDPSTGETLWSGAAATRGDVSDAVNAARGAFEKWALTPLNQRIEIMERYRDLIKRDAEELARLISRETGKPFWETKTEAATVSGKVDLSIRAYHERTGEKANPAGRPRPCCATSRMASWRSWGPIISRRICRTGTSCRRSSPATRSCSSRRS